MRRTSRRDSLVSTGLGLLALAIYLLTVAPGVLEADAGEFQFAAYLAGIAHPTGYPLYLLLGWAWSHALLIGSAAYRMNLLSAVFAALSVGLAARLVLRLTPRATAWSAWSAAAGAGLALVASPTFWSQSIIAEVYTLHALLLAALFLVTLSLGSQPRRWWMIGLVAGIGLTHHRTFLLYLPGAVLASVMPAHRRPTRREALATLGALALPLLLYAYIPLRAPHSPYLTLPLGPDSVLTLYRNTWTDFVGFVLGRPFGSAITLDGLPQRAATALTRGLHELSPIVWGLAALGTAALARRHRPAATLILFGLVANLTFNLVYDIGDIHVFYLPVYLIACCLAGVGLTSLQLRRLPALAPAAAVLLVALTIPRLVSARSEAIAAVPRVPESRWEAILASAPLGAALVSNDRNEIMPMWYYQHVDGLRPDLVGLFPLIVPESEFADIGAVVTEALAASREVYLIKDMPGLEVAYHLAPATPPLIRVVGAWNQAPNHPLDALLEGRLRLLGSDLPEDGVASGATATITLFWQPLEPLAYPYSSYVHVVTAEGEAAWPGSDHRPGGVYYPATLWKPGQVLRDEHLIGVPADAEAGQYRLIAGMYEYPSLAGFGPTIELGTLTVDSAR